MEKYLGGQHEWPMWFKGFLVFGVVVIAGVFFFYTQTIISQIKESSRRTMQTYARLWQLAASAPTSGAEIDVIFEEIIQKSDFPIVVTDAKGELQAWPGTWTSIDSPSPSTSAPGRMSSTICTMGIRCSSPNLE
jgi:hypothetical protein